ncbi:MAG: bifunctional alpha,alpha-trehalose-phosphate synthase (UDP-forming)/trehalose-phosphatase [Acholeplasmataceae bacterium]
MSKLIFVSNRLPVTVKKQRNKITYQESVGGLATGLKQFHEQSDSLWLGWPGVASDRLTQGERETIGTTLEKDFHCHPVFLSEREIERYYEGYSNRTIWPLFHYFPNKTDYETRTFKAYQRVNERFFKALDPFIEKDAVIWVHDYQLMLLPALIKQKYPDVKIGFFLHIPFPSYEIFRLLVDRDAIITGLLGADLIGFHTYGYVRHFLSSVRRLLNIEHHLYKLHYNDRVVEVDAFPMGIDYEYFHRFPDQKRNKPSQPKMKTVLSVDRLDYTKGIIERIRAFEHLLKKYPKYRRKVRLNLIVAPSRDTLGSYEILKRHIEEIVSEVNGKYGDFQWMPIWFLYQRFPQADLISYYREAEVMLVTPIRDGMNLVAKEYIASRKDMLGMLVISETAGAASELSEAITVNTNDLEGVAQGIKQALDMPKEQQRMRNQIMHQRLARYDVSFWASDFLSRLERLEPHIALDLAGEEALDSIVSAYRTSERRLLLLDYDGTLVDFKPIPSQAYPTSGLKKRLKALIDDERNHVVIISGRDQRTLEKWFGSLDVELFAAHGLWHRPRQGSWHMTLSIDNDWKKAIIHVLQRFVDRMPGALIEEKTHALALHYRNSEPDMVAVKIGELKEALLSFQESTQIEVQQGHMVLEVKDQRINKGIAKSLVVDSGTYDFILAAGDDRTDEDLFRVLDDSSYRIKIGYGETRANYRLRGVRHFRKLLDRFIA